MIVGIILLLFGAGQLFFLVYEWKRDCRLFSSGIRTTARITDRTTYPNEDEIQSSQYRLIGEFTDPDEHTHFVKSRKYACGAESRKMLGSEMEIVFLEENPETARFAQDEEKHISYWGLLGYSLTALAGILVIVSALVEA